MAIDRAKTLQVAQRYVDRKRYDHAILEYQKLVTADPTDARTRLKIGDLQARSGAYAEAISTYDEVGRYYAGNGFALKAIAVYKQIRELIERHVPQLADRYGHILPKLAAIYTELGLTSDALAAYDEVATRLQKSGRDREAIEVFERIVSLDPTNPLPLLRHAEACIRNADTGAAVASFWAAAQLLLKMGRPEDALRVLERLLHFRSESEYALAAARIYLDRATPQDGLQALAKLQLCFQANPHDLVTLEQLARAFTLIGQRPKSIEVRKEMARIAYELGQADKHREITTQLLADAPGDEQVIALAELRPRSKTVPPGGDGDEIEELSVEDAEELVEDDFDELDVAEIERVKPVSKRKPEPVSRTIQAQRVALNDAESFLKLRLYAKAVDTLRAALRDAPMATELRIKLRDVLAESGDRKGALTEMLTLARLYWEHGNTGSARQELAEIIEFDPGNPAARQMLAHIAAGKGVADALVSYDIEAVGVERAMSTAPPAPELEIEIESIYPEDSPPLAEDVQEALVEADFFVSRELYEDAKLVLLDQLSRTPGHPAVQQRLTALESRMAGLTLDDAGRISVLPNDDAFAIAASLDSDELGSPSLSAAPSGGANLVNVDEVFAKFKEGVRAQVSEADSATHYDLGVAYKEMGLLPDAIGEFELAARDPAFACTCHAMVGMIHEETGDFVKARAAYTTALGAKRKTPEQTLSLHYDLGDVCEKAGALPDALESFRRASKLNAAYRDVGTRVQKLERLAGSVSTVRDREKDYEDDDVDAAFDRLMETK